MGTSYCVVFEAEVPGLGTVGGDNNALQRALDDLLAIATETGLTPLQRFESYGGEDVAGLEDMMEIDAADLPAAEYYDAADGIAAVEAITEWLQATPGRLRNTEGIISDLQDIAAELAQAKAAGVRFRFAVVL